MRRFTSTGVNCRACLEGRFTRAKTVNKQLKETGSRFFIVRIRVEGRIDKNPSTMGNEEIHVENYVKQLLQTEGKKMTWLAEKINYSPKNISQLLKRSSLESHWIERISDALGINLYEKLAELYRNTRNPNNNP